MVGRLLLRFASERPLSKPLVYAALQIAILSALFSFYHVEIPIGPALSWIRMQLHKIPFVRGSIKTVQHYVGHYFPNGKKVPTKNSPEKPQQQTVQNPQNQKKNSEKEKLPVFTPEQLALFDGTRPSNPMYLAILGRVYDVDKGRKHYGQGGGYHFFAGKDASRAFVSGDFTPEGLTADVSGLTDDELLSISDWMTFYERDYQFVGLLAGLYYDRKGQPTEVLEEVNQRIHSAKESKQKRVSESEVFPPCNSEWRKEAGGRVWCTSKSGGVVREWVGVPRKLFNSATKRERCVCVKNFGPSLLEPQAETNRGDLDSPNLREYEGCEPSSNSCKIPVA